MADRFGDRFGRAFGGPFGDGDDPLDGAFGGGPRGGGPRGGGRGRDGGGRGEGGGRGRVLGRGELPLVVLALLNESPRHGYEIIRAIEERCGGGYAPSAGVIYPTLTLLEEQELTQADPSSESGKRRYLITEAGRRYVAENDGLIKGAFARMDLVARMRAREALPARVVQAMETLKQSLLAPGSNWDAQEAERIAAVLEQAALSIVDRSSGKPSAVPGATPSVTPSATSSATSSASATDKASETPDAREAS